MRIEGIRFYCVATDLMDNAAEIIRINSKRITFHNIFLLLDT